MEKAYNPSTGEVVFLVNNQWVKPTDTAENPKTGERAYLVNNQWEIFKPPAQQQASPAPTPTQQVPSTTAEGMQGYVPRRQLEPALAPVQQEEPVQTVAPQQPASAPVDDFEARLAAQEARRKEFSFGQELGKGVKGALEYGFPSMAEQIKLQGTSDAFLASQKRLELMNKIDSGAYKSFDDVKTDPLYQSLKDSGQNLSLVNTYYGSRNTPDVAAKLRGKVTKEFEDMSSSAGTSIDILNKYARENKKKYGARVEKFTDINWTDPQVVADFTNWLGYNMGSAGVQLAPIMVASLVAKRPGVLSLSSAMETAGAVQDRVEAIQQKVKNLPPEKQAEAITKYVAETGDTNLMLGLVSGSYDLVLGPAAKFTKMGAKQLLEQMSKKGAAKAAVKELPKDILQEGVTGALQEATQIAGKKYLGEEGKRITEQNIKDIINAATAEAAGAPVGTAINVARDVYAAPSVPKEEPEPTAQDYEDLAKSKGFLRPTTKAETDLGGMGAVRPGEELKTPVPPVPPTGGVKETAPPATPVGTELETKAAEDAAVQQLIQTSGLTESQARRIVKAKAARESEKKPRSVVTDITNAVPTNLDKWSDAALQQTLALQLSKPDTAPEIATAETPFAMRSAKNIPLIEAIQAELQKRGATQGETDVGQPDTTADRTGDEVAVGTDQGAAAQGVAGTQRDGMVSTGTDVTGAAVGKAGEPATVKEKTLDEKAIEETSNLPTAELSREEKLKTATDAELEEAKTKIGGSDISYLSVDTIQAEIDRRKAEAAKVETRGRKALPAEQKAAKETKRKSDRKDYTNATNRFKNNKDNLQTQLDEANQPLDEGEFEDEEALAEAQEDKRAKKAYVINQLLDIEQAHRGSPLGKEVKKVLDDRTKITQQELDKVKQGREVRRKTDLQDLRGTSDKGTSPLASRAKVGKPDAGFSKATNGSQALTRVIKTGNAFQRLLAARLRPFVAGVKFVVVERGDPTPEQLQSGRNAEAWERALGLYIQDGKQKIVYVRGSSFGNDQGVNNITVLHELLHAATNAKIELGMLASVRGFSTDAKITRFVEELNGLAKFAQDVYNHAIQNNIALPPNVRNIIESTKTVDKNTGEVSYEIFDKPQEFLAYGMSDPDFQIFLNKLPGRYEDGFSRFVRAILNLFGLGKDDFTALSDLINITDKMLSARKTPTMRLVETGIKPEPSATRKRNRDIKELEKEWKRAKDVYQKSAASTKFKTRGLRQKALERMNPQELMDWVKSFWPVATKAQREVIARLPSIEFLGTLASDAARDSKPPIDTIPGAPKGARYGKYEEGKGWRLLDANGKFIEYVKGTDFPHITQAAELMTAMVGSQKVLAENTERLIYQLKKAFKGDPALIDKVSELLYVTTNAEVNPSDPNATERIAEADQMYADLNANGVDGQALYKAVVGHYENRGDLYIQLLEDNLNQLNIDPEQKKNALAVLRKVYEAENRIEPYVAFVRDEGDYWLSVGKGENKEFYIYESMVDRDADRKRIMAERNLSNEDVASGDSLNDLRQQAYDASALLKEVFKAIDSTAQQKGETDESFVRYKESLKDAVYQGYLSVMPERSFRGMFKHRKGLAGYRTDLIQNIAVTDGKMNTQLARLEYGQQLRNVVDSAKEITKDRRDLQPFVNELSRRVDNFLSPAPHNIMDSIAGVAGRFGFTYMLTGLSLPFIQPLSLVGSGLPILWGNYKSNPAEVGGQLIGAFLNLPSYGITTTMPDGSTRYQWPSLVNSNTLQGDELRAMKEFGQSGLHESTLARSVWDHAGKPTSSFIKEEGKEAEYYASRFMQGLDTISGSPFHIMERWTREALFLAAYRLGRNKDNNLTHEEAVKKALANVKEALGDYDTHAKPRWMQRGAGKMAFALKTFSVLIVSQTLGNLYKAIPVLNKEGKKEAIKKFSGIMFTMSLLAGASGMPMASVFYSFAASLVMALGMDDEDEDEDLELKNTDKGFWFRSVWLPRNIPNVEIGGVQLYDWLDRGILNAITGFDFASRLQVSTLFGQETPRPAKTTMDAVLHLARDYFVGAYYGLFEQLFNAYDAYKLGDEQRAKELASPKVWKDVEKSMRFADEGVKFAGREVIEPGDLSKLLIWGQALGFTPDIVSTTQKEGTKIAAARESIRIQRDALLEKLDIADRKDSDEGDAEFERIMDEEVDKFNDMFPNYELKDSDIQKSLASRQKIRDNAIAGVAVDKKDEDAFSAVLDRMEERIERNAAKMQKKREAAK